MKQIKENDQFTIEIAVRELIEDSISTFGYYPDPDYTLQKLGQNTYIYREILTDPTVHACLTQRKSGILSLEWDIDRDKAPTKETELIKKIFTNLDIRKITNDILDCIGFGLQPLEVLWQYQNGNILPINIIAKPQEWFVFNDKNELRLRTKDNQLSGIELPQYKFLLARHNPTYQNPYGDRLLSKCYWPVTLKRAVVKYWATMTEKYGMPWVYGKHPPTMKKEDRLSFLDSLKKMVRDALAVIPENTSINLLETQRTTSADIYEKAINYFNKEIAKVLLSTSLTVETNDVGVYSSPKVQQDAVFSLNDSDKKIVENVFNDLIKWIYQINFSNSDLVQIPKFGFFEEEDVDKALADRDKVLTEAGVKFTKQYFMQAYNLKETDFDLGTIQGEPANGTLDIVNTPAGDQPKSINLNGAQIASAVSIVENVAKGDIPRDSGLNQLKVFLGLSPEQAEAVMGDAGLGTKLKPNVPTEGSTTPVASFSEPQSSAAEKLFQLQIQQTLKPVIELINSSSDYSEVIDNLASMYPDMKTTQLESLLEKAIFYSQLAGRLNSVDPSTDGAESK